MKKTLRERFYGLVERSEGCWIWRGAKNMSGYPMIWKIDRNIRAHRVSYELHKGNIPDGLCVCHSCDTPLCVNPDHLYLGTRKDNYDDMVSKDRGIYGTRHVGAKLTDMDVLNIRNMKGKVYQKILAKQYGVSRSAIGLIMNGDRWKHLLSEQKNGY